MIDHSIIDSLENFNPMAPDSMEYCFYSNCYYQRLKLHNWHIIQHIISASSNTCGVTLMLIIRGKSCKWLIPVLSLLRGGGVEII